MKATINLLPLELRVVWHFPWRRLGRAMAVLVAACVVAAAAWGVYSWLAGYNTELHAVRAEATQLRAVVSARDELVRVEGVLKKKQGFVDQTKETRSLWRALRTLGEAAPSGVTMGSFALEGSGALTVEGVAPSLVAVARFLRGMETSGFYISTQVVFPQPFVTLDGQVSIPFKITASLGGG